MLGAYGKFARKNSFQESSARRLLSAFMLECWLLVCCVKITFTVLLTNCFVSTTANWRQNLVNWIPLRIRVRSRNSQPHRGNGSEPRLYSFLVPAKIRCWDAKWPNARRSFIQIQTIDILGLVVIHEYQGEGSILTRKCHTWKDCCHNWTDLNTNNGEIGTRSRPYQPEAFKPSSLCRVFLGLGTKNFFFFLFSFSFIHSPHLNVSGNQDRTLWKCNASSRESGTTFPKRYF